MQVWAGFFITNAILPICMLYTAIKPTVEWSGTHYRKSRGRISRLELPAYCEP